MPVEAVVERDFKEFLKRKAGPNIIGDVINWVPDNPDISSVPLGITLTLPNIKQVTDLPHAIYFAETAAIHTLYAYLLLNFSKELRDVFQDFEKKPTAQKIKDIYHAVRDPKVFATLSGAGFSAAANEQFFSFPTIYAGLAGFGGSLALNDLESLAKDHKFHDDGLVNKIKDILEWGVTHPKMASVLTTTPAFYADILNDTAKSPETIFAFPWYMFYAPWAIANDNIFGANKDKKLELRQEFSAFKKAGYTLLNNSKIAGLLAAAGIGFGVANAYDDPAFLERFFFFGNIAGLLTQTTLDQARNKIMLNQHYKETQYEFSKPAQLWNKVLEHPEVAFFVGAALNLVQQYGAAYANPAISTEKEILLTTMTSLIWGLAATGIYTITGGTLHSESLKKIKHGTLSKAHSVLRDFDKAIEHREAILEIDPVHKPQNFLALYNLYVRKCQYDEALEWMDKAVKSAGAVSTSISTNDVLRRATGFDKIGTYSTILKSRLSGSVDSYLRLAFNYLSTGKIGKFRETWDKIITACPEPPEFNILYARGLDISGEQSDEQWTQALYKVMTSKQFSYEKIGESANGVFVVGPNDLLRNSFVLKPSTNKKSLEDELQITKELSELVECKKRYLAQKPIILFGDKDVSCFSLVRDPGENLLSRIENQHPSMLHNLEDTIDYLAYIHARFFPDVKQEGVNYDEILFERLSSKASEISEKLFNKIYRNFEPVRVALSDSIWAFNKDAHPENWLVTENGLILAIDCENKGLKPIEFDVANLMNYGNYWKDIQTEAKQKRYFNQRYVRKYNEHTGGMKLDKNYSFELKQQNAVIARALDYFGFFSDKPGKRDKYSAAWCENAIRSIFRIRTLYPDFYQTYEINYARLIETFMELRSLRPAHSSIAR